MEKDSKVHLRAVKIFIFILSQSSLDGKVQLIKNDELCLVYIIYVCMGVHTPHMGLDPREVGPTLMFGDLRFLSPGSFIGIS